MSLSMNPNKLQGIEREVWIATFAAVIGGRTATTNSPVSLLANRKDAAREADDAVMYIRNLPRVAVVLEPAGDVGPHGIHGHCPTVNGKVKPTKTWRAWSRMREEAKKRGLRVVDRWNLFETFLADMGTCPKKHVLRMNRTVGHFGPDTCSWMRRGTQPPIKGRADS